MRETSKIATFHAAWPEDLKLQLRTGDIPMAHFIVNEVHVHLDQDLSDPNTPCDITLECMYMKPHWTQPQNGWARLDINAETVEFVFPEIEIENGKEIYKTSMELVEKFFRSC